MKRGKDEEKIMGPMFPRLHVNDTEKGGPKAPPRNKMALYEQLSIPSQRFNNGAMPLNPNNSANKVPPASSSQGSGLERGMFFQLNQPRSTHPTEKSYVSCSDFNTPLTQLEQKKRLDEEDFMVPTFVRSEISQHHGKDSNGIDRTTNMKNMCDKELKRTSIAGLSLRQEGRSQNEENPKEFMAFRDKTVRYVKGSPAKEKTEGPLKQTDAFAGQERRHCLANNFDRLQSTGARLHHEYGARSHLHNSMCGNGVSNEPVRGKENGCDSIPRRDSCLEKLGSHNNTTNDSGYHKDKTRGLPTRNWDRSDDASETSIVESISGLDISPDDVVGIIGQKHFWKARRAIVNQQRVFSVQVFELHRLIKVQRLIAGSPNLWLQDSAYLGKPLKVTSAKILPLEYIVKHKGDSENPNHKMECSAENAFGKTSLSSVQNVGQPSNYSPFSGKPLSAPVIADAQYNPCFHQPPGHQWLVPVMSPSEGLIYKPYPGHGFVGPVCGGCGPLGSNPMMGSFVNPAYGVLASHHHFPGIGVPPSAPPVGHSYFPPYGMPVINPVISGLAGEQENSFGGVNFNVQQQSSCNLPTQKHRSIPKQQSSCNFPTQKHREIPNVVKLRTSKENELQGSTASSPGEKAPGIGVVGHTTEGRNAVLSLFPTSAAVHDPEGVSHLHVNDHPARVIKVVPHNARSATESAARIFQSIQEERKQYDPV